jgi:hypothetical protein
MAPDRESTIHTDVEPNRVERVARVTVAKDDGWLAELAAAKRVAVAAGPRHVQEHGGLRLQGEAVLNGAAEDEFAPRVFAHGVPAEAQTACADGGATALRPAPELQVPSPQDDNQPARAWTDHLALVREIDEARVTREHGGVVEVRPRTAEEIHQLLGSSIRASSNERALRRLAAIQRRATRPTASPGTMTRRAYRARGRRRRRSAVAAAVHSGPDGPSPDDPAPPRALRHRATPRIGAAR